MKEIILKSNKHGVIKFIIDDDEYERVSCLKWYPMFDNHKNSYRINSKIDGKIIKIHRFIMNAKKNEFVDHINGDILDNRKSNLRKCSLSENNRNKMKHKNGKTSKYKGVSIQGNRYRARIRFNDKYLSLGMFESEDKAAIAYNIAALKYYGNFSRLNNVMEVI